MTRASNSDVACSAGGPAGREASRALSGSRFTGCAGGFRLVLLTFAPLLLGSGASAREPSACATLYASGQPPAVVDPARRKGSRQLCFRSFAVLHSGVTRSPLYAAEAITPDAARAAMAFDYRDNRFHPETRLPSSERAELADYVGSGFDRGHMAPSGDMSTPEDDFETFSLANMVPQAGALNRSGWASLEQYVRSLAVTLGSVYVVTGPSYETQKLRTVGGRVLVPSHVWKAVYVPGQGAGAWIATNEARSRWRVLSVAALTARTGVDPFPALSAEEKRRVQNFPLFGEPEEDSSGRQ